jgi:hypothetical protein
MPFMINGFGTATVGRQEQADGTFVTTEWLVILFVPVFPVRSYRIVSEGSLEGVPLIYMNRPFRAVSVPLDAAHVRRVYTRFGIVIAALVLCAASIMAAKAIGGPTAATALLFLLLGAGFVAWIRAGLIMTFGSRNSKAAAASKPTAAPWIVDAAGGVSTPGNNPRTGKRTYFDPSRPDRQRKAREKNKVR